MGVLGRFRGGLRKRSLCVFVQLLAELLDLALQAFDSLVEFLFHDSIAKSVIEFWPVLPK